MLRKKSAVAAALALLAMPGAGLATAEPSTVQVLFESRQLDQMGPGSEVTYKFERKVSNEKLLGAPWSDRIKVGVLKVNGKGEREVVFQAFTGEQARDPSNWPDLTINPIFIWYLERAVSTFSQLAGGSQQYLKHKFREALKDKAEIEAVKFNYNGKEVNAYRVTTMPYADDPNSPKMEGFENSRFTIVVSDEVPGYFADLVSQFESKHAGAPSLEEHISLVGMGEAK